MVKISLNNAFKNSK